MCVCVWVGGCVGGGGEGLDRLAVYFRQVTSSHILPLSSSFAVLQLDNLKVCMFCMAVLWANGNPREPGKCNHSFCGHNLSLVLSLSLPGGLPPAHNALSVSGVVSLPWPTLSPLIGISKKAVDTWSRDGQWSVTCYLTKACINVFWLFKSAVRACALKVERCIARVSGGMCGPRETVCL